NVELLDELLGVGAPGAGAEEACERESGAAVVFQEQVVGDGELEDDGFGVTVFGDVGEAIDAPANGFCGGVLGGDVDGAGGDFFCADDGLDEVGLSVAVDAGDADDFTGMDIEGEVLEETG